MLVIRISLKLGHVCQSKDIQIHAGLSNIRHLPPSTINVDLLQVSVFNLRDRCNGGFQRVEAAYSISWSSLYGSSQLFLVNKLLLFIDNNNSNSFFSHNINVHVKWMLDDKAVD